MKSITRLLGTLLMAGGIAVLVYVGVSYERSNPTAASPRWTPTQQLAARTIRKKLTGHQTVAVPKRLMAKLPAAGSEPAVRIVIPKIGVDAPVVQTQPVDGIWNVADWAVGHLATTPNPGAPGNSAMSAHDDIKGEVFKRLGALAPGDQIRLYTRHAMYAYVVTNLLTVDPSNVSVLNPTVVPTVTLISCAPYWVDTERLVVQGILKSRAAV